MKSNTDMDSDVTDRFSFNYHLHYFIINYLFVFKNFYVNNRAAKNYEDDFM